MDGSFEYHTQLSQWNLFNLRFDHFIEDQKFFELRFLKRIRHRETTPTPFDGGHEPKKSNLYPSQGEKECAACLLMIKLHIKDTCSDCYEFVGKFPGAQPLFSHLRRKKRRMLALDSDESGSEAPWLGSSCWSVVRAF